MSRSGFAETFHDLVGLPAFSRAFVRELGRRPGQWALEQALGRVARRPA